MKKFLRMFALTALLAVPWATNAQTGFCTPSPTSVDNQGITNVTFGVSGSEIVNNTQRPTASPYYGDYRSQIGAIPAGTIAQVSVTFQTNYTYGTIIWVDWNNDSVFSGTEVVYVGTSTSSSPTTLDCSFNIPATQDTGLYMMRIGAADSYFDSYVSSISAAANADPCWTSSYAVCHDYTLHVVEAPSCLTPDGLAATVSGDTATLTWTAGEGNAWEVIWGPTGFNPDTVITNTTTVYTPTCEIPGLTAGTWQARIRTICSGEQSFWTLPVAINVGLYYMSTSGSDTLRSCSIVIYDDGGPSNSYSGNCQSTLVLLPSQANSVVKINGSAYTEGSWDYLTIYDGIGTTGEVLWTDNGVSQNQTFGPFMSEAMTIVFHSDGSVQYSGFEINVSCEPMPTCPRPDSLMVVSVDTSEVTLQWVDANGSTWAVEYGPAGFIPGDASNPDIHFADFYTTTGTVTGLNPGTKYDFYLMSVCGSNEGDTSWTRMVTTYTNCAAINAMPYTENWEGFETGTSAEFHPCWTKGNNNNSSMPYIYENTYGSYDFTSKVLYFYSYSDGFNAWAVMPTVGNDFEMNELELSLDAYLGYTYESYGHSFLVGVIDSNVYVPGMAIDTIANYSLTVADHKDISFADYTGTGRNIILLGYLDGDHSNMYLALDNIDLHVLPQCNRPDSLSLVEVDSTSLQLSWVAPDGSSDFYVEWRNADSNTIAWSYADAATNEITISNLTPNTLYNVRIRTVCSDDSSLAVNGQFRTSCTNVTTFPWTEDFETPSATCWSTYDYSDGTSDNWTLNANYSHGSGSHCYISPYAASSTNFWGTNWLVSPAIEISGAMEATQLSYWVFGGGYDEYHPHYAVKISTTSSLDTTAFTTIFEETRNDDYDPLTYGPSWHKITLNLGQYAGQTIYIAFVRHANYDNSFALDDITVQEVLLPEVEINGTPAPVIGLTTSYAAQLNGGLAAGMTYAWNSSRATAGTATMTAVDSANITMLYTTAGIDTLRLIATNVFGSDTSYLVVNPITINFANLPYSTGFETNDDNAWTISNGPNGWYIDSAVAATGLRSLYVSSDSGANNNYSNSSTTNSFAYKAFNFATAGQYGINFDWRNMGENNYDYIQVSLVPADDTANMVGSNSSFTAPSNWVNIGNTLSGSSNWQTFGGIFNITAPGVYHVCFRWRNDGSVGTNPAGAIDNIEIAAITCPAPVALAIDTTLIHGASFHWTSTGSETSWEVKVGNLPAVTVTDTFYTANGLNAGTMYNVRVRAICGVGDTSMVLSGSFWTECDIYNTPYYIHFNTNPLNICWSNVYTSTTAPSVRWSTSATYNYEYIYSRAAYVSNPTSDYLISPVINIPATDTASLRLVLRVAGEPYSYYSNSRAAYEVLVSPTGADNVAAFTDTLYVEDSINSTTLSWLRLPVNSYAGQNVRFAVRNVSRNGGILYLYDFAVRYTNLPMYIVYGDNTAMAGDTNTYTAVYQEGDLNGMTLSWTSTMAAAGQATILNTNPDSLTIVYNVAGVDSITFIATNSHGADTTAFHVRVMDLNPVTTIPYTTGFETTNNDNESWITVGGTNTWYVGNAAHNTGARALYVSNDGGATNDYNGSASSISYASRAFDIAAAGSYSIAFDWNCNGESNYDYLRAFFVPDTLYQPVANIYPDGTTSTYSFYSTTVPGWISLGGKLNQSTDWTRQIDTITLTDAGRYHLVFVWSNDGSLGNNPAAAIDNIEVNTGEVIICDNPVIDSVMAGETSIYFSFTGEATEYEVAYANDTTLANPAFSATTTDAFFTFNSLTAETQYLIGVRSICAPGVYSEWMTRTVTTAEHPCAVPTDLTATNLTYDGATLGWTEGEEGQDAWQIHISGTDIDQTIDVTTNSYTITSLSNGATYTFEVRAVCGNNRFSPWSDSHPFTTVTCTTVSDVHMGEVTTNSAIVIWTAPAGASNFEVNYGGSGFNQGTGDLVPVNGATTYTITGLNANTPYDVYVRTVCAEGIVSDWSPVVHFTTQNNGINDVDNAAISLYPNPASSTVTLTGIEGMATVTVVDMNGREAGKWTVNNGELTIDVTEMAQGAYFVRIVGEQVNAIRKLIVR